MRNTATVAIYMIIESLLKLLWRREKRGRESGLAGNGTGGKRDSEGDDNREDLGIHLPHSIIFCNEERTKRREPGVRIRPSPSLYLCLPWLHSVACSCYNVVCI